MRTITCGYFSATPLALGIAVSVAANMLARYPDLAATAGPIVSAWPPLALFGTHRLLHAPNVASKIGRS